MGVIAIVGASTVGEAGIQVSDGTREAKLLGKLAEWMQGKKSLDVIMDAREKEELRGLIAQIHGQFMNNRM